MFPVPSGQNFNEQSSFFLHFIMRQKVQPGRKAPPSTRALHLLLVREGVKVISQAEASRSRPDSASEAPVGKEWWNVSCFLHDTWAPSGIHDPTETGRRRDASSAWAHPGSTPEMQRHSSSPGIAAAARSIGDTMEYWISSVLPNPVMPDQRCHQVDATTHW